MATDGPLSDDQRNYYNDFQTELEAIKASTLALTTIIPEQTAALQQTLSDVYRGSGPSRGAQTESGLWLPGGSPFSSMAIGGGLSDAQAKQLLSQIQTTASSAPATRSTQASSPSTDAQPKPKTDVWGRPVPQQTADSTTSWRDRVSTSATGDTSWMHWPGTNPSAMDYLNMMTVTGANLANKRQATLDARNVPAAQAAYDTQYQTLLQDAGGDASAIDPQDLQDLQSRTAPPETKLGAVSDFFNSAQGAYAQGRTLMGAITDIARPLQAATNYAYQTGYQGDSSGLLGFRGPGAALAGFGQRTSQIGFALGNNVTPGQSADIYSNLFQGGWYGGASTDAMRTAAAHMISENPAVGTSPDYFSMMDQSTRLGASSLQEFNDAMRQVPDASLAAHTSISQTMSALGSMGQYNKSTGGTFAGGIQSGLDWQNVTGTPASVMQQLMQNPFVQGATFSETGLMPQMQGLLSSSQHTTGIMSAMNMLKGAIVAPKGYNYKDPITGLSKSISGEQQKEALMAQELGVSPEFVHTMLQNGKGWQTGMELSNSAETYQSAVVGNLRQGNMQGAYDDLQGKPWQKLRGALGGAVDSQGHHIFENWGTYRQLQQSNAAREAEGHKPLTQAQMHAKAQRQAVTDVTNAGDTALLKDEGLSGLSQFESPQARAQEAQKLLKKGGLSKQVMSDVAAARAKEIKKYQAQDTQKYGPSSGNGQGPQLQIELGPAAKKMFHLSDPNNQQKAAQNSGSASIGLNSYLGGSTADPYPNLDTAGGSDTFNYGGPNDPSTY